MYSTNNVYALYICQIHKKNNMECQDKTLEAKIVFI